MVDAIYNGRSARILYSADRLTAQSGLALDGQPELLFDYNERFMELVRGLKPKRVLLLGGGAYTLPRAIIDEFPSVDVTVIELDEGLFAIGQEYFGVPYTKRLRVVHGDAVKELPEISAVFDLIIIDVFIGPLIPSGFQTADFVHELQKHLAMQGTVAMNIIAGYYGQRSMSLRRQIASFESAFSNVQLFPAGAETSLWTPQNFILTASNSTTDLQPFQRYKALELLTA
ncbi:MAG TPA: fused MFS/spermidine synthase [Candidatus Saccharimonadales bacterium]|nr:fused MFS/spermidine synthase [Candidatus Saccharimonadales bacterium]